MSTSADSSIPLHPKTYIEEDLELYPPFLGYVVSMLCWISASALRFCSTCFFDSRKCAWAVLDKRKLHKGSAQEEDSSTWKWWRRPQSADSQEEEEEKKKWKAKKKKWMWWRRASIMLFPESSTVGRGQLPNASNVTPCVSV